MALINGTSGNDDLIGTSGADTLNGYDGDDTLDGLDGADVLNGGGGHDILIGGSGNDTLNGDDGDDILEGGDGDDRIAGGLGYDLATFILATRGVTVDLRVVDTAQNTGVGLDTLTGIEGLIGSDFNDTLTGDGQDNLISGLNGRDIIRGGGGYDELQGGAGNDDLYGEDGDDVLVGGAGNDILNGGAGYDLAAYVSSAVGVTVDLRITTAQNTGEGSDTLISIEDVTGSDFNDVLHGTDEANIIDGGHGVNRLYGWGGDDVLVSQWIPGTSVFDGGDGYDTLFMRAGGSLSQCQITGVERLYSPSPVNGDAAAFMRFQRIETGSLSTIGIGIADLRGISVSAPEIRVGANTGINLAGNTAGAHMIYGSHGSETITGGALDDQLRGNAGNDVLDGDGGNDAITGDDGNDTIFGGGGMDILQGNDGADRLWGGAEHDYLQGGSGNDILDGEHGDDVLEGGAGNDILIGGLGRDTLDGGDGYDVAVYFGVRRAYTATSISVSGGSEGGAETLTGIEDISFTDGRLTFHRDGQAAQVMRLYDAAFNRSPDQSGFEIQLDTLENGSETLLSLAEEFINSVEFQSQYAGRSNRDFVELLYNFCLNRNGDEPGIQTWVNALNGGQTRAQVLLAFSESSEHKDLLQGQLDQGLWVADEQTLQIARLYDATYDRLPDQAGLKTWRDALGGGMSLEAIAQAFTTAPEFQARYGALSNQGFVELMYQLCLNRNGDPTGIQTWVDALNGGTHTRGQVLLAFSESSEHIALTRPTWLGGIPTTDLPAGGIDLDHGKDGGAQVLPAHADHGVDDGAQVVAGVDTGEASQAKHAEAGPQVLPIVADAGDDAQVVPGADTGEAPQAKRVAEEGPQVLVGADTTEAGHDDALVLPGVIDDGFLLDTKGGDDFDAQILPGAGRAEHAELTDAGTDVDSLFDLDQLLGSDNLDDGGFHGSHHGGHDLDPNEIRHIDPWAA